MENPGVTANIVVEPHSIVDNTLHRMKYTVKFSNHSNLTIQVRSRHWIFTEVDGTVNEVKGEGVLGKQPMIPPGGSYSYDSFRNMKAPGGVMSGSFLCTADGESFVVNVPEARF